MGVDMIKKARGADGDQKNVLVSSRQIDAAARIEDSMFKSKVVPASLLPPDAFTDAKSLAGRVTVLAIPPGIPITKAMLAPPGAEPGLRARIPAGCRAVSVSVNEESAVAGFLTPGARVDVSAVNARCGISKLILTDVEVGAVGQSLSQIGADGKTVKVSKSVTLFLKPDQVEVLNANAGAKGQIRLALRGHGEPAGDAGSFLSQLFSKMPSREVVAREEPEVLQKNHVVEVVRGSEVERLVFAESSQAGVYQLIQTDDASGISKERKARGEDRARVNTEISE
jgi:pilus assembly protein CpaB